MNVPLVEAQARLPELMERARSGEDVLVELENGAVIQLTVLRTAAGPFDPERRRRVLEEIMVSGPRNASAGPSAARSQDFLYDEETGLPA